MGAVMQPLALVLVVEGRKFPLLGVIRIGRDPACQVVLEDPKVSRLHATVWLQNGAAFVRDENSSNGSFVNGRRLPPTTPAPLQAGDSLRCGGTVFTVTGDSTATIIDTRGASQAPAAVEPTGTFPLAGNLSATIRAPAQPASAPPPPRGRSRLPLLAAGCGLVILLLVCASIGLAATAGRAPLATMLAQLNPTAGGGGGATSTPPAIGTAQPATAEQATPDPNATPEETQITPIELGPAPTLLAPEAALSGAASLAEAVGALNRAELDFLTQDAAQAPAEALDASLLEVAARAMAVAQITDSLGETLGAQAGGSDQALQSGQTYASLSRLAYSLVVEAQNLRDGLRLGTLAPGEAAQIIGEYAARLWRPGFEGAAAIPAANDSGPLAEPFLPYAAGADLPPVRRVRPEHFAAMTAGLEPGTVLKSWLAVSSETVTRTVWVPALAPGQLAPDYFDTALAAQLLTPAGQADGEVARQVAAAHLRLLLGVGTPITPTVGPSQGAPLALFDRGAGGPQPLVVTLLSRAVAAQPDAPAGAAGGAKMARGLAQQAPPTWINTVPGGQVQALAQGGNKVVTLTSNITQQNMPSIFEHVIAEQTSSAVALTIVGVTTGNRSASSVTPGKAGLAIKLQWQAVNVVNTRRLKITTVCTANPGGHSAIGQYGDIGPTGTSIQVMILNLDETYTVECFALVGDLVAGGIQNGLVLGRTAPFSVVLPSFDDRDQDGVPDNEDKCVDTPEDEDKVQDADGCPETDADKDSMLDFPDACPEIPGPVGNYGCPLVDQDGDGIADYKDLCPEVAEDKDDVLDHDGCPDFDEDRDNIPDEEDKCPAQKEDFDNFEDADGCIDFDNDGDGLNDPQDDCPDEREVVNGFLDDDGCADRWPVYTFNGSIPEAAADHTGVNFTINTIFNITVDLNSGVVAGTLNGTGVAQVPFTCFNSDDHSEIYDHAKVAYTVNYAATVSGSATKESGLVNLPYTPAGTVTGKLSEPYTHEKCTHLNDDAIPGQGGFSGTGTLTLAFGELGSGALTVDWKTADFDSAGGWQGNGTSP
jgi:predicted component of type VI protein secretion system